MKTYKSITRCEPMNVLDTITCDRCMTEYSASQQTDDVADFLHVDVRVHSDNGNNGNNGNTIGKRIIADICGHCVVDLVSPFSQRGNEVININHEKNNNEING